MKYEGRFGSTENIGKCCRKGVGSNSSKRSQWIHGRCSGVSGKVQNAAGFRCKRCVNGQLF